MTTNQFGINEEILDNQIEEVAGGGTKTSKVHGPENAGKALVRLVGYVETGKETNKQSGKVDDKFQLIFDVVSPNRQTTYEKEGKEHSFSEQITVYLKKGNNSKSGSVNFMKRMDYGRGKTNFSQMLGDAFLVELFPKVDNKGVVDAKGRNVFHDGWNADYRIFAPVIEVQNDMGEVTGTKEIPVPASQRDLSCFLWAQPNKLMWDSIQISDKADNDEKNFRKAQIFKAENFIGSPVEAFLAGGDLSAITESVAAEPAQEAAPVKEEEAPVKEADIDPLAALGL